MKHYLNSSFIIYINKKQFIRFLCIIYVLCIFVFTPPCLFVLQGAQGPPGPKGDKVSFGHVFLSISLKSNAIHVTVLTKCVLQGEKGIGLAGPPGRVGPQGLKVSNSTWCLS